MVMNSKFEEAVNQKMPNNEMVQLFVLLLGERYLQESLVSHSLGSTPESK